LNWFSLQFSLFPLFFFFLFLKAEMSDNLMFLGKLGYEMNNEGEVHP